jgi:hypothetical protein
MSTEHPTTAKHSQISNACGSRDGQAVVTVHPFIEDDDELSSIRKLSISAK